MKQLFIFLLLVSSNCLYSQQQSSPLLQIKNDSADIELESLSIKIEILGNLARTSVEMTFYNPQDRVLEGELNFPLGEGQTVSAFAMDVNGKMREGVVVEKAKGRRAFETIVRGNIDPGLLEQTQGNNFKTRVYPIPANGRKSVRIGYSEELDLQENMPVYRLVMGYGAAKNFTLKARVFKQEKKPKVQGGSGINFSFKKWEEAYVADFTAENFMADKMLAFQIPPAKRPQVYQEKTDEGTFFYLNYQPKMMSTPKKAPASVGLLWDHSFSGKKRDMEKELELLDAYFRKAGSINVTLVPFASEVQAPQQFAVEAGDWNSLKKALQQLSFDGATRLNAPDLSQYNADEFLLFTDGLSTLSESTMSGSAKILHTINTSQSADHAFLRYLAESNGGSYLNLLRWSAEEAAEALLSSPFRFIRAEYQQGQITEVYPSIPEQVRNNFTMSGRVLKEGAAITLHFGVGNEVLHSKTFVLDDKGELLEGYLPKLWAGKKIAELSLRYDENEAEVTRLAKKFTIVTPGTSLIVLDRTEDYVRYEIVPPAGLQEEYYKLLKEKEKEESLGKQEILENLSGNYQERTNWWERSFPKVRKKGKAKAEEEHSDIIIIIDEVPDEEVPEGDTYGDFEEINDVPITEQPPPPPPLYLMDGESDGDYLNPPPVRDNLQGRVAGVQVQAAGVQVNNGRGDMAFSNEANNSTGANPLYIIDGVPVSKEEFRQLQPGTFASMNVISGEAATAIYGSRAQDGVVVLVTRQATEQNFEMPDSVRVLYEPGIGLKAYNPKRPYLEELRKTSRKDWYSTYLRLRENYANAPSFYLDVGNFFISEGEKETGLRILSNIAELQHENPELLRMLAHRYRQLGRQDYSIFLFEKVLKLREEEPQSYRDLALACEEAGRYQEALDYFYQLVKTDWREGRFPDIAITALYELNHLIALHGEETNYAHIEKELIRPLPVDVRVVLNWSTADTDMDLWVTDPYGETCLYSNRLTHIGGRLTADYTSGYGPEEFLLKEAIPGTYKVEVNYYGSSTQKIAGPVTLQAIIYTHYGSKKEKKEEITLQLEEKKGTLMVGEFTF